MTLLKVNHFPAINILDILLDTIALLSFLLLIESGVTVANATFMILFGHMTPQMVALC